MTHIPFVTTGAYPVRAGNRVRPLIDGEPAFCRVCDAIDQAQARVWVARLTPIGALEVGPHGTRFIRYNELPRLTGAFALGLGVGILLASRLR